MARETQTRSVLKRGDAAMDTLRQEQEKAEARREAMQSGVRRFYIGKNNRGKYQEHEVVILDDDARDCPFAHEHLIPGPGNNFSQARNWVCVDEVDNCVLCRAREQNQGEEFGYASYGMYVTYLDLTPYTIKNGPRAGQVVDATRKLAVIPQAEVATYMRMFELCYKQHGTTRGMVMVLTKDKQTDPRCGRPKMLDNGMLFDMMTEDELEEYANEQVLRDGKVIKEEGEDIEAFDYEEVLAPPDQEVVRKFYNLPETVGSEGEQAAATGSSRRARRRTAQGGNASGTQDEAPPARTRRQRAAQEAEQDDAPETTTRRRTRAAAPDPDPEPSTESTRTRTRTRAAAPDNDGHDDTDPPARTRRRRSEDRDDSDIPF